jgi:hypothetical protein
MCVRVCVKDLRITVDGRLTPCNNFEIERPMAEYEFFMIFFLCSSSSSSSSSSTRLLLIISVDGLFHDDMFIINRVYVKEQNSIRSGSK